MSVAVGRAYEVVEGWLSSGEEVEVEVVEVFVSQAAADEFGR